MCDRTLEFQGIVDQLNRSTSGPKVVAASKKPDIPKSRTAFNDAASEIAKGVHKTSHVLSKLAKLVKSQGLFDDPTEEINTLIYRIKQDLGELNSKCDAAQQYVDGRQRSMGEKNQSAKHSVTVVSSLKSELMNATKDFKTVLEMRSSKMKDQQQRKMEIAGSGMLSPMRQFNANTKLKQGGSGGGNATAQSLSISSPYATNQKHDTSDRDYTNNENTASQNQFNFGANVLEEQQLLLAPPATMQYFESREKAVTEVEKTIGELGQLFKRLATMIAQQQELVERIDDDVENSLSNAEKAHGILLKAYEQVSNNRGLYMKIGAIMVIFLLFFVLFLM